MSAARHILGELANLGATVEPVGELLILRAGRSAIPAALVRRVREAKSDLIEALTKQDGDLDGVRSKHVPDWLDRHPCPSPAGRCAWCGRSETASAVILPFGTEPETHTWLHSECWPAWHQARRSEALRALGADG